MPEPLLVLDDVRAGYGSAVVLDGISFSLPERGSLAVLGRNGVGKSTLLLTIMGYTQVGRGRIIWRGDDITRRPPHRRALAGIGWVAQEREIFVSLTVEENLTVAARPGTLGPARGVRTVSAACRTPAQSRQSAFRRRAANAGDRPRADDQSGAAAARRAAGRAGADRGRRTRRRDPAHDQRGVQRLHPGRAARRHRVVADAGCARSSNVAASSTVALRHNCSPIIRRSTG